MEKEIDAILDEALKQSQNEVDAIQDDALYQSAMELDELLASLGKVGGAGSGSSVGEPAASQGQDDFLKEDLAISSSDESMNLSMENVEGRGSIGSTTFHYAGSIKSVQLKGSKKDSPVSSPKRLKGISQGKRRGLANYDDSLCAPKKIPKVLPTVLPLKDKVIQKTMAEMKKKRTQVEAPSPNMQQIKMELQKRRDAAMLQKQLKEKADRLKAKEKHEHELKLQNVRLNRLKAKQRALQEAQERNEGKLKKKVDEVEEMSADVTQEESTPIVDLDNGQVLVRFDKKDVAKLLRKAKRQSKGEKQPGSRQAANRVDESNAMVKLCREYGFRVACKNTAGRDTLQLCPKCGDKNSKLEAHVVSNVKGHPECDTDRIVAYARAQFPSHMRGPLHRPTVVNLFMEASKSEESMTATLDNFCRALGIGLSDKENETIPVYDMNKVFLQDYVFPKDIVNDLVKEVAQEDSDKEGEDGDDEEDDGDENVRTSSPTQRQYRKRQFVGNLCVDTIFIRRVYPIFTSRVIRMHLFLRGFKGQFSFVIDGTKITGTGKARVINLQYKRYGLYETLAMKIVSDRIRKK